jgi:hypothetical protein
VHVFTTYSDRWSKKLHMVKNVMKKNKKILEIISNALLVALVIFSIVIVFYVNELAHIEHSIAEPY